MMRTRIRPRPRLRLNTRKTKRKPSQPAAFRLLPAQDKQLAHRRDNANIVKSAQLSLEK